MMFHEVGNKTTVPLPVSIQLLNPNNFPVLYSCWMPYLRAGSVNWIDRVMGTGSVSSAVSITVSGNADVLLDASNADKNRG
jgi:hypothetical protein